MISTILIALLSQVGVLNAGGMEASCHSLDGKLKWTVTGDCTKVSVQSGATIHRYGFPQYRCEQGGFWLNSMLPLERNRLLITQHYGKAIIIDAHGHVLYHFDGQRFPAILVNKQTISEERSPQPQSLDTYECLLARCAKAARIVVTFTNTPSTMAILTDHLRPVQLVRFRGEAINSIEPSNLAGWMISLSSARGVRKAFVSGEGSVHLLP